MPSMSVAVLPARFRRFASIGGARTFDGIFLTGILAVLLASFSLRR